MDLKALLGDKYRDDLTLAEITTLLNEVEVTPEIRTIKDDKDSKENIRLKAELKKLQTEGMGELDILKAENQELKASISLTSDKYNKTLIKSKLSNFNLKDDELNNILGAIKVETEEEANKYGDMLSNLFANRDKSLKAEFEKNSLGALTPPDTNNNPIIKAFKDMNEGERIKLKQDNPDLFFKQQQEHIQSVRQI